MSHAKSYLAPKAGVVTRGELEIKRSRFITLITRVSSEEQARAFIAQVRAEFPDARHHCSAFIYATPASNPVERSSDDGEPSGTAGQPMLEVLRGSSLCDVAAVVVRYFGGVKLGTGGLVRAYSDAVSQVLPQVERVWREQLEIWELAVPHAEAGRVEAELRARGLTIADVSYADAANFRIAAEVGTDVANIVAALTKGNVQPKRAGWEWVERNSYTG